MASLNLRVGGRAARGQWTALGVCVLAVAATGTLGAIASIDAREFYATLAKPDWAPPPGVFAPAWTVLYVMIAIAGWLAWRARAPASDTRLALGLYFGQLALNALWSWLFFAWHQGALALVEICVLWLAILATLTQFWRLRPLAGALLVPYLAWVSFATALTAAVWRLNPGPL
jgi:tryptophan-rich sensory protein